MARSSDVGAAEDGDATPPRIAELRSIQKQLHEAGYAGFTFPVEYGGQGLTLEHEHVFLEEAAGYRLPNHNFAVSINILGGTLVAFGTEDQKRRHLPKMLSGEELWLQLLSEPSGGSDLAGLLTSASRDGDVFIVNGQKTWSSGADFADFALCPVRTRWDVAKHQGISVLIVDLSSPGIEIRPIKKITGRAEFCEEFFTDVRVPVSNLLGEEDEGWRVLKGLLEIEHAWVGRVGGRGDLRDVLRSLVSLVERRGLTGDPHVRRRIADMHVAVSVQKLLATRVSEGVALGKLAGSYGSVLKLGDSPLRQRLAEVGLELAGSEGVAWTPGSSAALSSEAFLESRSATIAGGTNEIQRNNVSERVLGMPREVMPSKDVPFNQIPHN
jgi:alkylation response protein AidB-like acyl-CoA dehydrogenase